MRIESSAICRLFRFGSIAVGRDKPPACHFSGSERRAGNDRCPHSVTPRGIASYPIVIHRQHGFFPKHLPVVQLHRHNRLVGRTNDYRNGQRTNLRLGWILFHHGNNRPRTSAAFIRLTRSGNREETPHKIICQWGEAERCILELCRVGRSEGAHHRHSVRGHEREVFAIRRESEICVQTSRRIITIFP